MMTIKMKANINPHVLAWARQAAGYDLKNAAHKIGVSEERLQSWEDGSDKPTLRQLRLVAKVLKRPTVLFYRSTTPENPPMIRDFRLLPTADVKYSPALLYGIRRAFQRRAIALELTAQMGESPKEFPLEANMNTSPIELATIIREMIGINIADQISWTDHYTALRSWITAIENLGVFVFQLRNIDLSDMRGFSISERPFPVIGINSKDSPRGRIFTLFHELTHIVLSMGGICDLREPETQKDDYIEVYCNRVAGEVLVPSDALLREVIVIENNDNKIWEDWQLKLLANRYMVSQEVILRRLLTCGKTTDSFYKQKRAEYEIMYLNESKSGRPPYYRIVLRDNGPGYTNLVLSAYYNEAISSRDLSNFLGGIKLNHIDRIENALIGNEGGVEV